MKRITSESGFTLLELLLVIGVAAVLFLGITQITRSWVDAEVTDSGGQHLQRVSNVVQKYIEANGLDLKVSSPDVLNDAAWTNLKTALDQEGLLTGGKLHSPLGVELQIAYVYTPGATNIYRASIFSKTNLPNKKATDAARQAGTVGGTVTNFPSAANAVGAFGQWSVPVANLGAGAFPCAITAERGCLVAVVSYTSETLCGAFLYRDTNDCIDANKMSTDLNMSNNNITGARAVETQDLNVANNSSLGATTVTGTADFNGPTTMSQGATVNNGLAVSGDANFSGNVAMASGTLNVTELNAAQIKAPEIQTNNLNAQDLEIQNGTMTVDDNVTVSGDLNVGGSGAEIYTSTLNAGNINAANGQMIVGQMEVKNTMQIDGNLEINGTGKTIAADKLIAQQCLVVNNVKYGTCP